jgi:hypothetical protein
MQPFPANLEVTLKFDITNDMISEVNDIIVNEYNKRQTSDLKYIDAAKLAVEIYLDSTKNELLESYRENIGYYDATEINNIEVELIGEQSFGMEPPALFKGFYRFTITTPNITVVQMFPDKTIAYYSKDFPTINFIQLSKNVECIVLDYPNK